MRPIPLKLRKQLAGDPYMTACKYRNCGMPLVEWNHAIIYTGKQLNEWYAIIPLCYRHHRGQFGTIPQGVRDWCELEAIDRSGGQIKKDCPKVDWDRRREYLLKKCV